MNFIVNQLREILSHFPKRYHTKKLHSLAKDTTITIIDVGSTGGPDPKWRALQPVCQFITFDPDPRAKSGKWKVTNYPIGLWSSACKKSLNLAEFPPASSLFSYHSSNLSSFLNASCHQILDTQTIQLDTLDHVLQQQLDVLKIDAEGAELEILKGVKKHLIESCFVIEVEVSFLERHCGAPLFHQINEFLREYNFDLIHLQREHWIRKNGLCRLYSSPQLIWGNATYIISKEVLFKRLKKSDNPHLELKKCLAILLTYHFHDYALEICHDAQKNNLITSSQMKILQQLIQQTCLSNGGYLIRLLLNIFIGCIGAAICFPNKSFRLKFLEYLHSRVRELGQAFLFFSRSGPNQCAIHGP